MKEENYFVLNPKYRLKLDQKRVLLYFKDVGIPIERGITNFLGVLHPVLAVLLSLFDGERNFLDVTCEFSFITGIDREFITPLAGQLILNKTVLKTSFADTTFYFPENTLIPVSEATKLESFKYNPGDFLIPRDQLDFKSTRMYDPFDAVIVLNNICETRCIYCYVDNSVPVQCTIPFPRLAEIIQEGKSLGMRSISLSGGEVFTYPHWKKLLRQLIDNQFHPLISTKYPLNQEMISQLTDMGIKRIQISLDTVDKAEMEKILQVNPSYHPRILKTLELLDKNGVEININGQITAFNQDNMESYFNYLVQFQNVRHIRVRATGYSQFFKGNTYKDIRPDHAKLNKIKEQVLKINQKLDGRTIVEFFDPPAQKEYVGCSMMEKSKRFNQRSQCSANFSSFQILPDGKVTICEESFYHPQLIIGDILTQSIQEVWNSEKALSLYRFSRDAVCAQSACKTCPDFDPCHQGKGVCWKLAIYAYGESKWDYPDPRCPLAPEPINEFWIPAGKD